MHHAGPVFSPPRTPAAKCLNLIRLSPVITRTELIEATGLSQPTITRAVTALLGAGLIRERNDLTRTRGRGRPTVPLETAENNWALAGIAVGTRFTYITLYDTAGRLIREEDFPTPVATLSPDDFIEHIMAGVNKLSAGLGRKLVSVGVVTSGHVEDGRVWAPNLGWEGMDVASRLAFQFRVPIAVTSVVPAILGSESQAQEGSVLVLYADDTVGAALSGPDGVHTLDLPHADELATATIEARLELADAASHRSILDERARRLAEIAAELIREHGPDSVVIAGGAFSDDPAAPQLFAAGVRGELGADAPHLRMIPTHREIVRAIARAVAVDPLLRDPLSLT